MPSVFCRYKTFWGLKNIAAPNSKNRHDAPPTAPIWPIGTLRQYLTEEGVFFVYLGMVDTNMPGVSLMRITA